MCAERAAVQPLLPVVIEPGGIRYAPGISAGPWVFATGHKGVADFAGGMDPGVLNSSLPSHSASKLRREAERVFGNLERVLVAGGSDLRHVVRVDQNYTTHKAVEPYHDARRAILADHIPPSTSTLTGGLLLAGQEIEVHMIGVRREGGLEVQHLRRNDPQVHPSSGYSLGLAAGDLLFVAGRMADSFTFGEGIAPEARMPPGHLWKGDPVKLEAEFVIRRKIMPVLESSGSSMEDVLKWQVYLRDPADFPSFMDVWRRYFPRGGPVTTLVPTADPGFFLTDARIEINTIAVRSGSGMRRRTIDAGVMTPFAGIPQAVVAGDLMLVSGLLAVDSNGLIGSARPDPGKPHYGSPVQAQMRHLLDRLAELAAAAGTGLENVVRIQHYHTDLAEFYPAYQTWSERLPHAPLPISAVRVPFLPVPGCTVMVEAWLYVP